MHTKSKLKENLAKPDGVEESPSVIVGDRKQTNKIHIHRNTKNLTVLLSRPTQLYVPRRSSSLVIINTEELRVTPMMA